MTPTSSSSVAAYSTQAHVEDKIKELKAVGAENLPSKDWNRNSAWLQLAALAASLNAWLRHLALDDALARAEPKALRFRLLGAPARHVTHARKRILKVGYPFHCHFRVGSLCAVSRSVLPRVVRGAQGVVARRRGLPRITWTGCVGRAGRYAGTVGVSRGG